MPKTPIAAITVNPSLLAFKPRQLLLSNSNNNNNNNNKTMTMKPDQKALLVVSIAQYLERNGFSKTLKKFQSEAQIVKDDLSASSPDLEEIYCKYLETCNHASSDFNKHKAQDIEMDGNSKKDGKKKKRSDDSDSHAINNQSGVANKLIDSKNAEEMITDDAVPEVNVKSKENKKSKDKKKKKSKLDSESLDDNVEHIESLPGATEEKSKDVPFSESKKVTDSGTESKSKDKKKKKNKLTSDSLEEVECLKDTQEVNITDVPLEDKSVKSKGKKKKKDGSENLSGRETEEDVANKENKGSKKRKRLASEENDSQPFDQNAVEESKRRKTEGSEDPKGNEQSTKVNASMGTDGHAGKESNGESNKAGQETYIKKLDALANGNLEKSGEKFALQKTLKKEQNGSAEPKTVKPFQRVKVDEVAFTDERLQDNSYWAKDGAESGYGAKAQEVLGQVRGRDFRHEKTKKKRGTYRGGQIDLHSHSIKFNYSDDE